ncbi:MAG: metalloregulator ArsR/SmtB family transcription factor [Acidobacteria bacterium]|nr:metalloregulator ArsR/SmtB family transcription factor [Acidobacteriota bacterium]
MDRDAETFQALADPTRLRLLNLLRQAGGVCVCEFVDALRLPQYNISRHLQVLRQTGLVEDHKRGKWVYYSISKHLEPYQRALLRAVDQLREGREDFRQDEARAGRRLKLRRDGLCCVGLVQQIGEARAPGH